MVDRIVRGAFAVLFAAAASAAAQQAPTGQGRTITLLHTNDLHGHVVPWRGWEGDLAGREAGGLARLATLVRTVRAETADVLLLDAGDTLGDTMEAAETNGSVVVAAMNAIGYDAMVIGNHEPDFTAAELERRRGEARFSMLAANVRREDGTFFTRPFVWRDFGRTRVAVIGLAYPNTPLTTSPKNVSGLRFRDAIHTARELVPLLRRQGADVVVALTHLGLSHDQELARHVPGIDVIVGGHSHNRMTEALRVGSTLIVQAGAHGSHLGRLDLTIADGSIVSHRRSLIPVTGVAADREVDTLLQRSLAPLAARLEEPLAVAQTPIVRAQTLAGQEPEPRAAESPADSLFADLVRAATSADVTLLPGVGYGVAIPEGPVRARDLRNLLPHQSKVFRLRLTAHEIRAVLERAVQNVVTKDVREKVGGMLQVSGLEFRWNEKGPPGKRVESLRIGGVDPPGGRAFDVTVNGLLAEGGHRQSLLRSKPMVEAGDLYELVASELRRRGSVVTPAMGRISRSAAPQGTGTEPSGGRSPGSPCRTGAAAPP